MKLNQTARNAIKTCIRVLVHDAIHSQSEVVLFEKISFFFCKKSKRTAERRTIFPVFLSSIFMSKINVFLSVIIWSMSIRTKNLDLKFLHQHSVLSLIVLHSSEQLRPLSEFATSNIFEQEFCYTFFQFLIIWDLPVNLAHLL